MAKGFRSRMLMEYRVAQGQSVFTNRAWRRLFEVQGLVVHEFILEFFSTYRFGETVLNLDTVGALQFQLGRARRCMSWREFILGMGLHTANEMESTGFVAYWVESARRIPDKGDLSAYWREISIAGRSQAPKKVTMTDLFYLKGMDVGSVNIPYLLARFVRSLMILGLGYPWDQRGSLMLRLVPQRSLRVLLILLRVLRYTSYSDFQIPYVRRTRRRTNDASTSAPQQPNP
ncbi:hypothetical protein Tco_1213648 [Tanacetum coccineum]